MIEHIRDLIVALGGTHKLAESIGVVESAVRNWRDRDEVIPATYYRYLKSRLKRRGLDVHHRCFKFYAPPSRRGSSPRQADQQDQSQVAS